MSIIHDYRLTHCSIKLLEYLFYYRGMTALQLSQMYYETYQLMPTQKSSIHNYLNKLKKKGLVESKKTNDLLHPGSVYSLTTRGLDVAKDLLNIDYGAEGNGYILLNGTDHQAHADLPFDIYSPPKKQVEHHLLLIDFFISLRIHFYDDEYILHRLSMYCSVEYPVGNKDAKIRPDAEIMLANGDIYWIEIDRATESHAQLLTKFHNYKHYFKYLKDNELLLPMKGILFVTDTRSRSHGIKRRWASILSAFLKVMHPYDTDVQLLLTPLHDLEKTLRFEMQYNHLKDAAIQHTIRHYKDLGYEKVTTFNKNSNNSLYYAFALRKSAYKIIYLNINNTFDSSVYTNFHDFLNIENHIKEQSEVKGLQFEGMERIVFHCDNPPFLLPVLHGSSTNKEIEEELKDLLNNVEFIQLEMD